MFSSSSTTRTRLLPSLLSTRRHGTGTPPGLLVVVLIVAATGHCRTASHAELGPSPTGMVLTTFVMIRYVPGVAATSGG